MNKTKWKFQVIKMKHINDFRKSFQKTGYKAEVDDLKKIFARKIYDRDQNSEASSKQRYKLLFLPTKTKCPNIPQRQSSRVQPIDKQLRFQSLILNSSNKNISKDIYRSRDLEQIEKKVRIRTKRKINLRESLPLQKKDLLSSEKLRTVSLKSNLTENKQKLKKLIINACEKQIVNKQKVDSPLMKIPQKTKMKKTHLSPWQFNDQEEDYI